MVCEGKQATWLQFNTTQNGQTVPVDLRFLDGGYEISKESRKVLCAGTAIVSVNLTYFDPPSNRTTILPSGYVFSGIFIPLAQPGFIENRKICIFTYNYSGDASTKICSPQFSETSGSSILQGITITGTRIILDNPNCKPLIACDVKIKKGDTEIASLSSEGECPPVTATCGCETETQIQCAPPWEPDFCCLDCASIASQLSALAAQIRGSECFSGG